MVTIMNEIDEAVKIVRSEYEKALDLDFVNDPVAYALYHSWRRYELIHKLEEQREKKQND